MERGLTANQSFDSQSTYFGMKRRQPQNTSKHESKRLDQLYDMYQTLYTKDKKFTQIQTEKKVKQHECNDLNLKLKTKNQQEVFKLGLDEQTLQKMVQKADTKIQDMIHAVKTEQTFLENENLYMLHPKIMVTPDYVVKQKQKKLGLARGDELQQEINQRQAKLKKDQIQTKHHYQQEMDLLMKQMNEVTEARRNARKGLQSTVCRNWQNQIATLEVQEQARKEQNKLCGEIMFGSLKDKKKVAVGTPDANFKRKKVIMDKQRENAERKASDHILNVQRPYQYAFIEIDPKPDIPLDHIQWGNPATSCVPMSHYQTTFMDPKIIAQRRQKTVEAAKLGLIEEEVLDQIERVLGVDNANSESFAPTSQEFELEQEDSYGEEADVLQDENFDSAIEPAYEDAPKANDQLSGVSSISGLTHGIPGISNIESKTVFSLKSHYSKHSVFSKMSKSQFKSEVFETRSIRPNISQQQSRGDRSLQKVTKQALENFDLPMYKQKKEQDTTSIASSMIKRKIREAVHDTVQKEGQNENLNYAQTKAQLDALRRFVLSMETEAVQLKRIAEERRGLNQNIDTAQVNIQQRRKATQQMTKMYQLNQIFDKKQKKLVDQIQEKAVPDIQGDEGYPPQFVATAEEAYDEKQGRQNNLAIGLVQQMIDNQRQKNQQFECNLKSDLEYQEGFKTVGTNEEFRHTAGNMGKLGSFPQDEVDRKKMEMQQAKEIWGKTIKLAKVKQEVANKLELVVHEDKLDLLLKQKDAELQKIDSKSDMSEATAMTKAETVAKSKQRLRLRSQVQLNRLKHNAAIDVDGQSVFHKRAASMLKEESSGIFTKSLAVEPVEKISSFETQEATEEMLKRIQHQIELRPIKTAQAKLSPKALNSLEPPTYRDSEPSKSAWSQISKIIGGVAYEDQFRKKDLVSKGVLDTKHRQRKSQRSQGNLGSEVKQQKSTTNEQSEYPWEQRQKMEWKQYRNQIAKKPNHEYRYELLI